MYLRVPGLLVLLAATPCSADCHVDHFNFFHGSEAPATMHAGSGAPCLMNFTNGRKSNIDFNRDHQATQSRHSILERLYRLSEGVVQIIARIQGAGRIFN